MVEPPGCRLHHRDESGAQLPFLAWRFAEPWRVASSASVGGGIGERSWIINAQVAPDYARVDLDDHVKELALAALIEEPQGVGLLTAADVSHAGDHHDGGVVVRGTVGIRLPVLAGTVATHAPALASRPGTINLVVLIPYPLTDAALVNVATTVTEAKAQALFEAGVAGTGTASDAVAVACPRPGFGAVEEPDPFGGPLSAWGGRSARASYAAVLDGIAHSRAVMAARPRGNAR